MLNSTRATRNMLTNFRAKSVTEYDQIIAQDRNSLGENRLTNEHLLSIFYYELMFYGVITTTKAIHHTDNLNL